MTAAAPAPRCADCRFFVANNVRRGTCRFNAPQWPGDRGFPIVEADDWCRRFAASKP